MKGIICTFESEGCNASKSTLNVGLLIKSAVLSVFEKKSEKQRKKIVLEQETDQAALEVVRPKPQDIGDESLETVHHRCNRAATPFLSHRSAPS